MTPLLPIALPPSDAPRISARPSSRVRDENESLLVLSDVHLGSDLNDQLGGDAIRRSKSVDADLIALIAHYRVARPAGRRWRLVVAGDFIDSSACRSTR